MPLPGVRRREARERDRTAALRALPESTEPTRPVLAMGTSRQRSGLRQMAGLLGRVVLSLLLRQADGCPGSPVADTSPHASAELTVSFVDSCSVVAQEILARARGEAGWRDPHTRHGVGTRGSYTVLRQEAMGRDGAPGTISLSRVTGDGAYTDLMDFSFRRDGSGCIAQACSESQVPSFMDMSTNYCNLHDLYCNLADGCPFALHSLDYSEGEITMGAGATHDKHACVLALVGDPPVTRFLSQRQDHFDRQNTRRWQQRFLVNDTWFDRRRDDAPVFLCVGGEGRPLQPMVVLTGTVHCAIMVDAAKAEGALILALEHRYYGESIPVDDFSTPNLRFLSSHQALADLASFHTYITSLYSLTAANRWVTFGGSYPGMMAAWARTQYPHLFFASVSSSAPVFAQLQMQEYQDVIADAFSNENIGGSQACLDAIREAFAEVGRLLGSVDGRALLSELFPICDRAGNDPLSRVPAQREFVSTLSGGFNHQVNDPACGEEAGQTDRACDYGGICQNFMIPSAAPGVPPLERLATIFEHMSHNVGRTCIELGPDVEGKAAAAMVSPSLNSSRRIWFYQTCAEFGFYQTCDPGTNCPFTTTPHLDTLEVSLAQCEAAFGMTPGEIAANVAWSNTVSGGRNPGVDRVLWVQGDMDPWFPLGVVEGPDVLMVPDASHHFWTHVAKESDQPSVKRARTLIKAQIRRWLQSQPAVITDLRTLPAMTDAWASADEFDRVKVARWFDTWGNYVAAKQFESAKHLFATEAVGFGTWMDYVEGRDALVNHQWRNVWPTISSFHHRTEDTLRVTVSTDRLSAVGLVLWTSNGFDEFGTQFDRPGRTTAVFVRGSTEEDWLCVHTHVSLANGVPQKSFLQPQAHREVVIQPIVCTTTDGGGAARHMVDANMVGAPFAAWGISVRFLPPQEWHNTNARDGLRSLDDLTVAASAAGVYDAASSVVHMIFVNAVDGHTGPVGRGSGSTNIAFVALDGIRNGEGPTQARDAYVVSRGLGRCLGLPVIDGDDLVNLMGEGSYDARLSASALLPDQAATLRESEFAVPKSPPPVLLWPASSSSVTFFYSDVEAAANFYMEELGLTQLPGSNAAQGHVDFRISSTSFLELRSDDGTFVHLTGEAKATALAFVTEDIDAWDSWATDRGWQRSHALERNPGSPHDGFVTTDPEGYKLEFEVFNPHPENDALLRLLRGLPPVTTALAGERKSFSATISWLYYQIPQRARAFHRETLGLPLVAVQPVTRAVAARTGSAQMADIYHTSRSGFFGAVDELNGMANWATPAAVVLSFGVTDARAVASTRASLQALGVSASLRNDAVANYSGTAIHDVEGYSWQWRSDARVAAEAAAGCSSSGYATTWWNRGTLFAGVVLAFIAAWCGWAARGSLSKRGDWRAAEADEMKRMLQDE
eukprot:COSAG03_NODE_8_length_24035_cov_36.331885_20_plen_1405_part_00